MTQHEVIIGNARLICGDCLEVLPTLSKVDAVITDPPYGIPHKFGTQTHKNGSVRTLQFAFDGLEANRCVLDASSLAAGLADTQFWFCGMSQISHISENFREQGLTDKMACWVKTCPPPAMSGNWWPSGFELAVYAYRPGAWFGDKNTKRSNVFYYDSYRHGQPGKENHPTQKPLQLVTHLVSSLVRPGGTVLDCFMGSGTTGMAALSQGIGFIGIEKDQKYFDIARRRIEQAHKQIPMFAPDLVQKAPVQMVIE